MINVPDIAVVDMTEVTVLGTNEVVAVTVVISLVDTIEVVGVTVVVSLVDTIEVVVVLVIGPIEVEGIGVSIMLVDTVEVILLGKFLHKLYYCVGGSPSSVAYLFYNFYPHL